MEPIPALLHLVRAAPAAPLRRLLECHGDAAAALVAGPRAWTEAGLDLVQQAALGAPDGARLDADLAWLQAPGHHLLAWNDPDYPALLRQSAQAPAALFVAGDPACLWQPQVAVVGSRHPSAGGREHARRFARAFAAAGLGVTSGLAQGIDAEAHASALDLGPSVAVVATGLDRVYPPRHGDLQTRLAASGAVVSEHPPGTSALKQHFPSRNRIIAGLALGTVVVEAALRSGALITARLAAEAGREVFALPGSIDNPLARGCHRLLRQGAALVETPEEVVQALAPTAAALADALRQRLDRPSAPAPAPAPGTAPGAARGPAGLPPDQLRVWRALGHDPVHPDQLAARTGLTLAQLAPMLLTMELDGRISAEHGRYLRRP